MYYMSSPRLLIIGTGLVILAIFYLLIWSLIKYGAKLYRFAKSLAFSLWPALRQNAYIADFISQQPQLVDFVKKRTNRRSFWGLNATILGLIFLYLLFAFLGIIEDFISSAPIVAADARINNFLLLFRSDYYIKIFSAITLFGRSYTIVSLLIILSLLFWLWQKKSYIIPILITLGGASLLSFLSKLAFHRARPPFPVYLEDSFAFPSGHATIAMATYGFVTYFLLRNTKKLFSKILILLLGLLIIFLIGLSRLYLGVHYLSDVLAGYLLGALWLVFGISLVEWHLDSQKQQNTETIAVDTKKVLNCRQKKLFTLILIGLELSFIVYTIFNYHPNQPTPLAPKSEFIENIFDLPAKANWSRYTERKNLFQNLREATAILI